MTKLPKTKPPPVGSEADWVDWLIFSVFVVILVGLPILSLWLPALR